MRILFVSALLPYPLVSGGQVRIYNLLKCLSKQHDITLYSFIRNEDEKKYIHNLSFLSRVEVVLRGRALQLPYLLKAIFGPYPWLLSTYDNCEMRSRLGKELSNSSYDLVHIEPFYVYPSLPQDVKIPLVVAEHNIEYTVYQSYADKQIPIIHSIFTHDVRKLKQWESTILRKAQEITSVSERDTKEIIHMTGNTQNCTTIANGVDVSFFSYKTLTIPQDAPKFVFIGNFAWLPNRDALLRLLREIWPTIKMKLPHASLSIVGANLPLLLKETADREGAMYQSHVSDIRGVYATSDMLLAPFDIGGGTKFKLLEAMASGVPVVTTIPGAYGLSIEDKKHARIAKTTEDFICALYDVIDHPRNCQEMTKNARRLVEQKYNWNHIAIQLSRVWKKAYETY